MKIGSLRDCATVEVVKVEKAGKAGKVRNSELLSEGEEKTDKNGSGREQAGFIENSSEQKSRQTGIVMKTTRNIERGEGRQVDRHAGRW